MKRFFPSTLMLTPFLVKHYEEEHDDDSQGDEPVEYTKETEASE